MKIVCGVRPQFPGGIDPKAVTVNHPMPQMSNKFEVGRTVKIIVPLKRIGKRDQSANNPNTIQITFSFRIFGGFPEVVIQRIDGFGTVISTYLTDIAIVDRPSLVTMCDYIENRRMHIVTTAESMSQPCRAKCRLVQKRKDIPTADAACP